MIEDDNEADRILNKFPSMFDDVVGDIEEYY